MPNGEFIIRTQVGFLAKNQLLLKSPNYLISVQEIIHLASYFVILDLIKYTLKEQKF